jgi:FkbM family methyltransferase
MIRARVRGGYALISLAGRLGMLDVIAQYPLGENISFGVPLYRADNAWDLLDIQSYEADLIGAFCKAIAPMHEVTLFDCGADIGTFSAVTFSRAPRIARIIAFEPNPEVFDLLRENLAGLPLSSEAVHKAVSNFEGQGRLERPNYDASDHARFLVPGDGPLVVTTIDSFGIRGGDVAIKVDVEGGELEVLKGAAETIASARECVVTVEANAQVARRIKKDPVECLRFLESVRPFRFIVAETGEQPSTDRQLLSESERVIWNVLGWTHEAGRPC